MGYEIGDIEEIDQPFVRDDSGKWYAGVAVHYEAGDPGMDRFETANAKGVYRFEVIAFVEGIKPFKDRCIYTAALFDPDGEIHRKKVLKMGLKSNSPDLPHAYLFGDFEINDEKPLYEEMSESIKKGI